MNKKICFIGAGLQVGGQERHLAGLANFYAQNGHDVSIICLFKTDQFFQIDKNIDLYWPDLERKNNNRLIYAARIVPYLRNSINNIKPDVILCFGEWFNPYVILSTRLLNIPIFAFDLMGPEIKLGWLIETSKKLFYRFANGIIVQTTIAAKIVMKKTGHKNIAIIPNPVNVINTDISCKKNQIITIGRLSSEKGHIILIEAFRKLTQNEWTLHIVGDGPERQRLEKDVFRFGIINRVKFHGFLKDFSAILGESDIFVLPSFYEGFPNALIEAMSVPIACISSDCIAGPRDIIEDGINGLLVEPGNVDAFSAAIKKLIENLELREMLAKEAYKIREILAYDKIAQRYFDFIFKTI